MSYIMRKLLWLLAVTAFASLPLGCQKNLLSNNYQSLALSCGMEKQEIKPKHSYVRFSSPDSQPIRQGLFIESTADYRLTPGGCLELGSTTEAEEVSVIHNSGVLKFLIGPLRTDVLNELKLHPLKSSIEDWKRCGEWNLPPLPEQLIFQTNLKLESRFIRSLYVSSERQENKQIQLSTFGCIALDKLSVGINLLSAGGQGYVLNMASAQTNGKLEFQELNNLELFEKCGLLEQPGRWFKILSSDGQTVFSEEIQVQQLGQRNKLFAVSPLGCVVVPDELGTVTELIVKSNRKNQSSYALIPTETDPAHSEVTLAPLQPIDPASNCKNGEKLYYSDSSSFQSLFRNQVNPHARATLINFRTKGGEWQELGLDELLRLRISESIPPRYSGSFEFRWTDTRSITTQTLSYSCLLEFDDAAPKVTITGFDPQIEQRRGHAFARLGSRKTLQFESGEKDVYNIEYCFEPLPELLDKGGPEVWKKALSLTSCALPNLKNSKIREPFVAPFQTGYWVLRYRAVDLAGNGQDAPFESLAALSFDESVKLIIAGSTAEQIAGTLRLDPHRGSIRLVKKYMEGMELWNRLATRFEKNMIKPALMRLAYALDQEKSFALAEEELTWSDLSYDLQENFVELTRKLSGLPDLGAFQRMISSLDSKLWGFQRVLLLNNSPHFVAEKDQTSELLLVSLEDGASELMFSLGNIEAYSLDHQDFFHFVPKGSDILETWSLKPLKKIGEKVIVRPADRTQAIRKVEVDAARSLAWFLYGDGTMQILDMISNKVLLTARSQDHGNVVSAVFSPRAGKGQLYLFGDTKSFLWSGHEPQRISEFFVNNVVNAYFVKEGRLALLRRTSETSLVTLYDESNGERWEQSFPGQSLQFVDRSGEFVLSVGPFKTVNPPESKGPLRLYSIQKLKQQDLKFTGHYAYQLVLADDDQSLMWSQPAPYEFLSSASYFWKSGMQAGEAKLVDDLYFSAGSYSAERKEFLLLEEERLVKLSQNGPPELKRTEKKFPEHGLLQASIGGRFFYSLFESSLVMWKADQPFVEKGRIATEGRKIYEVAQPLESDLLVTSDYTSVDLWSFEQRRYMRSLGQFSGVQQIMEVPFESEVLIRHSNGMLTYVDKGSASKRSMTLQLDGHRLSSIGLSRDSDLLFAMLSGGRIKVIDRYTGEEVFEIDGTGVARVFEDDGMDRIVVAPSGLYIYQLTSDEILRYRLPVLTETLNRMCKLGHFPLMSVVSIPRNSPCF